MSQQKFPNKKYKNIEIFFNDYIDNLNAIKKIDLKKIDLASKLLEKTIKNKKKIFVCGNGGSTSISNHYLCDYLKLLRTKTNLKPNIISLSSSLELITAIANDISYEEIFSYQAKCFANKGDIFIIISSSGNSKNIIKLAKFAKKNKYKIIGFTGFDGGKLKKISDISIHFPKNNYGLSEDSHHILMHIIMQYLRQKNMHNHQIKNTYF
jgi:D-sedoheptulose 7-phosphate isomerase